jgi:hypothetical protein
MIAFCAFQIGRKYLTSLIALALNCATALTATLFKQQAFTDHGAVDQVATTEMHF